VIRAAAIAAAGTAVALAALAFLHQELQLVRALLCGAVSLGAAVGLQSAWSGLPRFVARWLDGGVVTAVALIAAATTIAAAGLPYAVLRWQEFAALSATAGLVGVGTAALAYTHQRLSIEVAAQSARLTQLQQRALESQLAALSAQINPHFLFNTLNVLAEVVHEDEDLAEELITDLAAMMRYALRSSTTRVTLREELDVVRRLLRIEAARLGDRLRWRIDVGDGLEDVLVPGLLVQPLVENAVRHGVSPRTEGGSVEVDVVRDGDEVRVIVADDGPGLSAEQAASLEAPAGPPSGGTGGAGGGLRNVAERARLSWPNGAASVRAEAPNRLVLTFPAAHRQEETPEWDRSAP
jgi:signal transduction histidine kinase